jgi:hypothetical protein
MSLLVIGIVVEMKDGAAGRLRISSFDDGKLLAPTMALPDAQPGAAEAQLVPLLAADKGDGVLALGSGTEERDGVIWLWDARIVQILPPAEALRTWAALRAPGLSPPHLPSVVLTSR